MTRILAAIALLSLAAGSVGAVEPKHKIRWLIGHPNLDYFEEAAQVFKQTVERGTNGEIAVEIVESSDLDPAGKGVHSHVISAVASGEAQMGHTFTDVVGSVDPRLWAFEAPGLFRGYRHLEGVVEGPLGRELLEGLRSGGLVGLSFTYSGGANGLATTRAQIRRPEDLRGLKVGVFADPVGEGWLKELGAVPVPIPHSVERIPAEAASGGLDAVLITWRNLQRSELTPAFRAMNLVGVNYLVSVTYANAKFFDALPERHRALLREASRRAGAIERAKTIELNEMAKTELLSKGVKEVFLAPGGRQGFEAAYGAAYARSLDAILGKRYLDRVRAAADGEHPRVPEDFALLSP